MPPRFSAAAPPRNNRRARNRAVIGVGGTASRFCVAVLASVGRTATQRRPPRRVPLALQRHFARRVSAPAAPWPLEWSRMPFHARWVRRPTAQKPKWRCSATPWSEFLRGASAGSGRPGRVDKRGEQWTPTWGIASPSVSIERAPHPPLRACGARKCESTGRSSSAGAAGHGPSAPQSRRRPGAQALPAQGPQKMPRTGC